MCLNTLTPLLNVATALSRRWRRAYFSRRSQKELLRLYTPPRFPFPARHAQQLAALAVALIFSAGMPLLVLLACACAALFYCTDKYMLLRACRIPPRYTEDLMQHLVRLLLLAFWLHAAVAIWVFGQPEVSPSHRYSCAGQARQVHTVVDMAALIGANGTWFLDNAVDRACSAAALPNMVVFAIASLLLSLRALHWLLGGSLGGAMGGIRLVCGVRRFSGMGHRSSIFDEAFRDAPLREMERLKVAHSYQLGSVPSQCVLTLASFDPINGRAQEPPTSPTLLGTKPHAGQSKHRGFSSTGTMGAPVVSAGSDFCGSPHTLALTPEECSAYVRSLQTLSLPSDEPVAHFLGDLLTIAPLPASWAAARDRHGRLYFASGATWSASWQHPMQHLLDQLADSCRSCLSCSEADRRDWLASLWSEWTQHAENELSGWRCVPQDGGPPYYCNLETRETSWQSPAESVLAELQFKYTAISWLANREYIARITKEEPRSKGSPPVFYNSPRAPVTNPMVLHPHYCPSPALSPER